MELDIYSKIISKREDANDYRLCLTREELHFINDCIMRHNLVSEIERLMKGEDERKD